MRFTVIGAGLAGTEAAWQIANAGHPVTLLEMKPVQYSPAHTSPLFAELVCSNSLRSDQLENAVGLLKEELRRLDQVAYVRFASVYREFQDINSFMDELRAILEEKEREELEK